MTDLPFGLVPDPRMSLFIGGFDPSTGQARPLTPDRLREVAVEWPLSARTPAGISGLLKSSRDLFVQSYFMYEFLTIGVLLSLQAVEGSLRHLLGSRRPFNDLITRAHAEGLIDANTAERLHAGRQLRNEFSHPEQQTVWTYGMTSKSIHASHELVRDLFDGT